VQPQLLHSTIIYDNTLLWAMISLHSLLQFRTVLSAVLVLFFGYIAPCLNTVKAILEQDAKSMREYLTYWCVFVSIVYVGRVLSWFSFQKRYPPELKVLFLLWLTLPRFQGALRIYSYVIKPYFEKYESDIDHHIASVTNEVQARASRQFKVILWQLFLAPNDGVLSAALLGVNSILGTKSSPWSAILASFGASRVEAASIPAETKQTVNLSSSSLSKKLLSEFASLLREGMFLEVWRGQDIDPAPCEVQLMAAGKTLAISTAAGSVVPELTTRASLNAGDDSGWSRKESFRRSRAMSKITAEHDQQAMKIPIMLITDVSAEDEESLVVSISVPIDILSPLACLMYANQFSSSEIENTMACKGFGSNREKHVTLSLLAEGVDEAEGLQVGLQILIRNAKNQAHRTLNKILRIGTVPRAAMRTAFRCWRVCSQNVNLPQVDVPSSGAVTYLADDNFESLRAAVNSRQPYRLDSKDGIKFINDTGESDDDYGDMLIDEDVHRRSHGQDSEDDESLIEANLDDFDSASLIDENITDES
jgi:hypothetical protein